MFLSCTDFVVAGLARRAQTIERTVPGRALDLLAGMLWKENSILKSLLPLCGGVSPSEH